MHVQVLRRIDWSGGGKSYKRRTVTERHADKREEGAGTTSGLAPRPALPLLLRDEPAAGAVWLQCLSG